MNKFLEHTLLAMAGSALAYYVYWVWRDIQNEKRPPVTEEMVEEAFNKMLADNDFEFVD